MTNPECTFDGHLEAALRHLGVCEVRIEQQLYADRGWSPEVQRMAELYQQKREWIWHRLVGLDDKIWHNLPMQARIDDGEGNGHDASQERQGKMGPSGEGRGPVVRMHHNS